MATRSIVFVVACPLTKNGMRLIHSCGTRAKQLLRRFLIRNLGSAQTLVDLFLFFSVKSFNSIQNPHYLFVSNSTLYT